MITRKKGAILLPLNNEERDLIKAAAKAKAVATTVWVREAALSVAKRQLREKTEP